MSTEIRKLCVVPANGTDRSEAVFKSENDIIKK